MDDTVPVIFARILFQCVFDRIEDLVETGIADRVDGYRHVVAVGTADHLIELFVRKQGESLHGGIICIGP